MTGIDRDLLSVAEAPFEGYDIVAMPGRKWEVVRSVQEYTLELLPPKNRLLVVEPFPSLPTLIREAKAQNRSWQTEHGLRQVRENFWIYTPPPLAIPGHTRSRIVTTLNSRILAWRIKSVMRKLGFSKPLLWSFLYNTGELQRRLPNTLSIYDCIDNYSALARDERHRQLVEAYERDTCAASDLVFACSELLTSTRRVHNPNTFEVNCAADPDFFRRATSSETIVPEDIARLPKPIVGYMGGCDPFKLNTELIREIAVARPNWTIALVGYVWFGFNQSSLASLPNIKILGAKPYEAFPSYLKGMDVCLAPFNDNGITRYGDALKIYEYLAAGRPVVSTTNPAALRMKDVVHIADTSDRFVEAIESALQEPPEIADRRIDAVRPHNWRNRLASKWIHIQRMMASKQAATVNPG